MTPEQDYITSFMVLFKKKILKNKNQTKSTKIKIYFINSTNIKEKYEKKIKKKDGRF